VDLAKTWLKAGYIQDKKGNNLEDCKLNWAMKDTIIKRIYVKFHIPLEEKQKLLDLVIGDEKSDLAELLKLACEARIPSKDKKEEIWVKIIDYENGLSRYERREYMTGFFQRDTLCTEFRNRYVEEIKKLADFSDTEFMIAFVESAWPLNCISDQIIKELFKTIDPYTNDSDHESYYRNVREVAENMEIAQKVKKFDRE
jgi:hypothetical protein